ncbi:MAG: endolytic transglycosylase MltG, partial [Deltaproteobacteria bacterium]|nr:endolytic transglycosylase MltG [Deltaproteobacteria bacterium]
MPKFKPKAPRPKIQTGPSLISRLVGFVGIFAVIFLLLGFLKLLLYSQNFLAPETTSREVIVSIPSGAGSSEIARILYDAGIIRDQKAFLWAIRIKAFLRQPVNIKAGEQTLDPSLNAWETIAILVKGNFKLYPFTIPEGKNMADISRAVENAGLGKAEDFWALCHNPQFISSLGINAPTLEGYLYPETYNFPKGTSLKTIAKTMVDQFMRVWDKYSSEAAAKGLSINEVLTMASIVEKETGTPSERPLIAAVFFNRLAKNMRLQTDPTVIYGIPNFNGN